MADIVDFAAARALVQPTASKHPILEALNALALALGDHHHVWTEQERQLYETAVSYLCNGYTEPESPS